MTQPNVLLTLGVAATKIGGGVQHHHLDRLARRGRIPHISAGRIRLIATSDLPAIRTVCTEAGYYRPSEEGPARA